MQIKFQSTFTGVFFIVIFSDSKLNFAGKISSLIESVLQLIANIRLEILI